MTKTVAQSFLDQARKSPHKPAIRAEGFSISFDQLAGLVITYALHLQATGVTRRSTIAIRTDDPLIVITTALAAALMGSGWVFDGKALSQTSAVQVTHRFQAVDKGQQAKDGALPIDESWSMPPAPVNPAAAMRFPGFESDDHIWLFFPSSGTTGTPKFMALSHQIVRDRIKANAVEFPHGDEVCVFLFAVHSPPTLMRAICALTQGAGLVLSSDTELWLDSGVTHVFGSPSQIAHVLPAQPLRRKIRKALIGGDFLPDKLTARMLNSFEAVVNTYGSTEANLVVENTKHLLPDGNITTKTHWHDSVIEIVDDTDQPVANGTEGTVRIKNGYLVPGYVDSPEAQAAAFRDGWFYPGDRGVISAEGDFTVTGRTNDIFNLGGIKVNAALLDFVLQSVPGVADAVCFMMPANDGLKELVALIRVLPDAVIPNVTSDARIQIARTISVAATPAKFIYSDLIPRTENGKPDRAACVAMALSKRQENRL